ncbi:MAG: hypothetical protein ABIS29_14520, partial [Vicinamibacterales bacterium]
MPLVKSLLTAIVRADGDALVLHAGERPYVVAPTGQLELASRALTLDAVKGMLNELLSAEARQTLDGIGAVQHDLGTPDFAPGQSFSVVAARGGEDIWIEIRRHRHVANVEPVVEVPYEAPEPVAESEPKPRFEPEPEPAFASIDLNLDVEALSSEPIAANPERATPEPGIWNAEPGTWNPEP